MSLTYGFKDLHLASKYLKFAFLISVSIYTFVGLMKYRSMVKLMANPMARTCDGE